MKRLGLVTATALLLAAPSAAQAPDDAIRVATVDHKAERLKTIPIGDRRGDERRVVMSVSPAALGNLAEGDRLEVSSEFEVTICLKPAPNQSGFPCVGRTYGYSPRVRAQIVLAKGEGQTRDTIPLTSFKSLRCSQKQPNRNRHCVLVNEWEKTTIPDVQDLPCNPDECRVNVVVDASHGAARRRHKVVIGSHDRAGRVQGDRARLNVVRFRPGETPKPDPDVEESPNRDTVPVANDGREPNKLVLDSIALPNLEEGEALMADAKGVISINRLPYNTFIATELVLATKPQATTTGPEARRASKGDGEVGKPNGSNCTQGKSAYRDPCTFRKVGLATIDRDADRTLYLNLVAGLEAKLLDGQRWRSGNRARVLDRGFIRVHRLDTGLPDILP
jgi:hypothetical protein